MIRFFGQCRSLIRPASVDQRTWSTIDRWNHKIKDQSTHGERNRAALIREQGVLIKGNYAHLRIARCDLAPVFELKTSFFSNFIHPNFCITVTTQRNYFLVSMFILLVRRAVPYCMGHTTSSYRHNIIYTLFIQRTLLSIHTTDVTPHWNQDLSSYRDYTLVSTCSPAVLSRRIARLT